MIKTMEYKGKQIQLSDRGEGITLLLVHGYIEDLTIWNGFADTLAEQFRVVAVDLPGHGKTDNFNAVHSMELMADVLHAVLQNLKIEKCIAVGHSMGGYAVMAFVEKYPELLQGFSLFHSAPYSDNDEKKENRNRQIGLIRAGKKQQVYTAHIPNIFAPQNIERFTHAIEKAKKAAAAMFDDSIIAAIQGMKQREDRASVLKNSNLPFLYVIGKHDRFIPMDILDKLEMPKNSTTLVLENSGHAGFIEEQEKAIEAFRNFANQCASNELEVK